MIINDLMIMNRLTEFTFVTNNLINLMETACDGRKYNRSVLIEITEELSEIKFIIKNFNIPSYDELFSESNTTDIESRIPEGKIKRIKIRIIDIATKVVVEAKPKFNGGPYRKQYEEAIVTYSKLETEIKNIQQKECGLVNVLDSIFNVVHTLFNIQLITQIAEAVVVERKARGLPDLPLYADEDKE
jgi:hypothetical protein